MYRTSYKKQHPTATDNALFHYTLSTENKCPACSTRYNRNHGMHTGSVTQRRKCDVFRGKDNSILVTKIYNRSKLQNYEITNVLIMTIISVENAIFIIL